MGREDRARRLGAIRSILRERTIRNQRELLSALNNVGYRVTQATLSRDLRSLDLVRRPDGAGGYRYTVAGSGDVGEEAAGSDPELILRGLLSLEFSGNLGVIKTRPGHAGSVASGLDSLGLRELLGTVAGDDTILLVPRDGITRSGLTEALERRVPGIVERVT